MSLQTRGYLRIKNLVEDVPPELHTILTDLDVYLRDDGVITRIVSPVGSRGRGTWLPGGDVDTFFLRRDTTIVAHPIAEGSPFYWLKDPDGSLIKSRDVHKHFKMKLLHALDELRYMDKVRIIEIHTSIEIHFYGNKMDHHGKQMFFLDAHICYEVKDTSGKYQWFISASPPKAHGKDKDVWQISVDRGELAEAESIGATGRWAVRIGKMLISEDHLLRTYIRNFTIEHTAFYLKDIHPELSYWKEKNVKMIVRDILLYLAQACRKGHMDDYLIAYDMLDRVRTQHKGEVVATKLEWLAKEPQLTRHMMQL